MTRRDARSSWRIRPLIVLLVAAAMVVAADQKLRRRQDLIPIVARRDPPVLLPFVDFLADRIERKTQWNELHARLDTARSAGDREAFSAAAYELSKFISAHLSPDDSRRQRLLLELAERYAGQAVAVEAQMELFNPAWRRELRGSYRLFTERLLRYIDTQPTDAVAMLLPLAQALREADENALEREVLLTLRRLKPVNLMTAEAMRRLLTLLPAASAERTRLEQDLAAHDQRRQQLLASAEWYLKFEEAMARQDLQEAQRLRASPPADHNAFTASADAHLADAHLRAGRFTDALHLRAALTNYAGDDLDDAMQLIEQMSGPAAGPHAPRRMPPDVLSIRLHQWRGLLSSGRFDDARTMAASLFSPDAKVFVESAAHETALAEGRFDPLQPQAWLSPGRDQHEMLWARLDLKPAGAAVPANLHCRAELWLSPTTLTVELFADEPRADAPPATALQRDQEVWKDDCFELFFDPDRVLDFYYQIDINRHGTAYDARVNNLTRAAKPEFKPDKSFDLPLTVERLPHENGWAIRAVMPRQHLFPVGQRAVRFNVRRLRHVRESDQPLVQIYSWAAVKDGEHHPEQFGWLIAPQSE